MKSYLNYKSKNKLKRLCNLIIIINFNNGHSKSKCQYLNIKEGNKLNKTLKNLIAGVLN